MRLAKVTDTWAFHSGKPWSNGPFHNTFELVSDFEEAHEQEALAAPLSKLLAELVANPVGESGE